jgi:replicative DNA helicase
VSPERRPPHLPPQNLEAERSVLGSMLRDNHCIAEVAALLRRDNFYTDAHQKVFAAILHLWDGGAPADTVTVAALLIQRGQIHDVGGNYLADLWDAAPTAANAVYYARIVREKALVRSLIHVSTEILRDAYDQVAPPGEMLEAAERKIFALSQLGAAGSAIPVGDAVDPCLRRIDARREGKAAGLPAGFIDLDTLTGGFQDGELTLIAARPSVGKTAVLMAILHNLALHDGLPAFFATIEQSRLEVVERLLCLHGRVDSSHVRRGKISVDQHNRLMDAADAIREAPLLLDDSSAQTVFHIAANARRLKASHGIRAVCVDYLQLIEPESRQEKRHEQVGQISRRLKLLARELGLPVICLAQLNREVESRKDQRPLLSDLRDSGEIEQNADVVVLLHRPQQSTNVLDLILAKQRNGPTGELTLTFQREFYKFDNHAPGQPP